MSAVEKNPDRVEVGKGLPAKKAAMQKRRTKGVSARIREMVGDDPARIANILFDILENPRENSGHRIAAARELFDRGWGKAPSYAPIEGGDPLDATDLDKAIAAIASELKMQKAHPELEAEVIDVLDQPPPPGEPEAPIVFDETVDPAAWGGEPEETEAA